MINFFKSINYIRKNDTDIIFCQYNPGKILPFFKFLLKNKKLIYRETNIPLFNVSEGFILYRMYYNLFYNIGIDKYDTIITQSDDMKKGLSSIARNIDKNKVVLINNPIDYEKIQSYIKHKSVNIFGDDKDTIKLISVGRLSFQKGYDLLIKTIAKLHNKNIKLIILGTGEEENILKNIIREYSLEEQVRLLGFVENPYQYIVQADYFISSSRYEGFSNAVLESCACGVPVIANNYLGGINEIIKTNLNGEIIDIEDIEQFRKAISRKYNSKYIKEDIRQRFSVEEIIAKYERIFEE